MSLSVLFGSRSSSPSCEESSTCEHFLRVSYQDHIILLWINRMEWLASQNMNLHISMHIWRFMSYWLCSLHPHVQTQKKRSVFLLFVITDYSLVQALDEWVLIIQACLKISDEVNMEVCLRSCLFQKNKKKQMLLALRCLPTGHSG